MGRRVAGVVASLVLTVAALVVVGMSPSGAASGTIGQAAAPAVGICGAAGGLNGVQSGSNGASYVVPAGGGLITSWSTYAGPDGGTLQLEVWRSAGPFSYTLVGNSPAETIVANSGLNTFTLSSPIRVDAGDLLGLHCTFGSDWSTTTGIGGNCRNTGVGVAPSVGSTVTLGLRLCFAQLLDVQATVTQGADLAITKTSVTPASATKVGANVAYTIDVTNNGSSMSGPVSVSDPLPAGLTLVSAGGTGWVCTGKTTLTCTHDPIDSGMSASFAVTATVGSSLGGQNIQNCASITTGDTSDVHTNDEACADTVAVPPVVVSPAAAAPPAAVVVARPAFTG